jgi:nucleoside phosphorylase
VDQPAFVNTVRSAAAEGRLIVLIGWSATELGWAPFSEELARVAERFQPTRAALMRAEAADGKILAANDYFADKDRVPPADRAALFSRLFDQKKPADVSPLLRAFAKLPARHWFTTAYDALLKYALAAEDATVEIIDNKKDALKTLLSQWSYKRFGVYLAGRAFTPETLVYSTETWLELEKTPGFRDLLIRLLTENTILAFGFEPADPLLARVAEFVRDGLGTTPRGHYFLTTSPNGEIDARIKELFTAIQYSAANDANELHELLRSCRSGVTATAPAVLAPRREEELRSLAKILITLQDAEGRDSGYALASAAIVLRSYEDGSRTHEQLIKSVARIAHTQSGNARNMVDRGLAQLKKLASVHQAADGAYEIQGVTGRIVGDAVVKDIEARLMSYASRYVPNEPDRELFRSAITHIMLAQGMTLARSFINEDESVAYDLDRLVTESLKKLPPPKHGVGAELQRAIIDVLYSPGPQAAKALFKLAHAAFSLELLFLNPSEPALDKILQWRLYLDSNVALRILSQVHPQSHALRDLLQRCNRIGTPVAILAPFIEEIASHSLLQERILQATKISDAEKLERYVASIPAVERSPFLEWYLAHVKTSGWSTYRDFAQKKGIHAIASVRNTLAHLGVTSEGDGIVQRLDTSERETLWAELRVWRRDATTPGRKLRRNEATQVEWLVRLREQGIRSWFLSIDGQLRRALKTLFGGKYAGFVMTPAAWAHQLTELHWGEVDLSGFTSMMWSYPIQTKEERAKDSVLREVLKAYKGDAADLDPEHLRDAVDNVFSQGPIRAAIAAPSSEDALEVESEFVTNLEDILPVAVSAVLDSIATERARRAPEHDEKDFAMPHTSSGTAAIEFGIVTALPVERDAVLAQLEGVTKIQFEQSDTRTYYHGTIRAAGAAVYNVVVTMLQRMGNIDAALATADLIRGWQPSHVVMLGIAGGVDPKRQSLGDVVVANQVVYYESAKLADQVQPRPFVLQVDSLLLNRAQNFQSEHWSRAIPASATRPDKKEASPFVHIGPIASGEKVIASASAIGQLTKLVPKLEAVEMESTGVGTAAFSSFKKVGFLSVRAISDFADANKGDEWHPYSSNAAAAWLGEFIRSRPVEPRPQGALPAPTSMVPPKIDKKGLFRALDKRLNLDELKILCFLLDVDFDNVPGSTKSTKVVELITLFERKGQLSKVELAFAEFVTTEDGK